MAMNAQEFGTYLRESVGDIGYELIEPLIQQEVEGCPHLYNWLRPVRSISLEPGREKQFDWYCTVCGQNVTKEVDDRSLK